MDLKETFDETIEMSVLAFGLCMTFLSLVSVFSVYLLFLVFFTAFSGVGRYLVLPYSRLISTVIPCYAGETKKLERSISELEQESFKLRETLWDGLGTLREFLTIFSDDDE